MQLFANLLFLQEDAFGFVQLLRQVDISAFVRVQFLHQLAMRSHHVSLAG